MRTNAWLENEVNRTDESCNFPKNLLERANKLGIVLSPNKGFRTDFTWNYCHPVFVASITDANLLRVNIYKN